VESGGVGGGRGERGGGIEEEGGYLGRGAKRVIIVVIVCKIVVHTP